METLRLVDVTGEGHLVLMSADGRRFELPVDAEVRSAVRRDRAPGPQPRSDRPGPREVQARIRAGADAESVADATGLDLSYVQRFEGPALAERRHVADLARLSQVHRDVGARQVTLEAAVLAALADTGIDAESLTWDSRRVEGSRWDVVLMAPAVAGEPPLAATWRFDVASRLLEEVDDPARRLTHLEQRRLSPVRDRVFDIDAGRAATVKARRAAAPETSSTAALLEALAAQRGRRPQPLSAGRDGDAASDADVEDRGAVPVPISKASRLQRGGAVAAAATPEADAPPADLSSGEVSIDVDLLDSLDLGAASGGDVRGNGGHDSGMSAAALGRRPATARRPGAPRGSRTVARAPVPPPAPATPEPATPEPAAREPATHEPAGHEPAGHEPAAAVASEVRPDAAAATARPATHGATSTAADAPAARVNRRRRAGVPSWDDIVFGARPDGEG